MINLLPTSVMRVDSVAPDMRIIDLNIPLDDQWFWHPGQYVQIHMDPLPPRFYSIASIPTDGVIRLHIRDTGNGGISSAAMDWQAGDHLSVSGPYGEMILRGEDSSRPILMIAGGTGVAPFCAMLSDLTRLGSDRPVTLLWGVQAARDFYCMDQLDHIAPAYRALTRFTVAEDRDGKTIADGVARLALDFAAQDIYLAGPPAMVAVTLPILLQAGADPDHIYGDDPMIAAMRRQEMQ